MTDPAHISTDADGTEYLVRLLPSGSRIVSCSLGWVARVDRQLAPTSPSVQAVAWARKILRYRMAGKTLPAPWGRVIKYARIE